MPHFLVSPSSFWKLLENFLLLFWEISTIPLYWYIQIYLISSQYFFMFLLWFELKYMN